MILTSGHGLALEHYRTAECGVLEEVEPVERNLFYDFNFQQQNTLPRQTKIFPVSSHIKLCMIVPTLYNYVYRGVLALRRFLYMYNII